MTHSWHHGCASAFHRTVPVLIIAFIITFLVLALSDQPWFNAIAGKRNTTNANFWGYVVLFSAVFGVAAWIISAMLACYGSYRRASSYDD